MDIARQRLENQGLSAPRFDSATQAVEWFGAVQAQDFQGAKWALGQRLPDATDVDIEQAFNEGSILRTHIMRPTWHFVSPADIWWLLKLTAPRVKKITRHHCRRLELDDATLRRSSKALRTALKDGRHLNRESLRRVMEKAGITVKQPMRLAEILIQAELDGLICSGPLSGKQFTYALLQERAPQTRDLSREAALAELTRRFFTSHGPATLADFSWWSGLTLADAKVGVDLNRNQLTQETIADKNYFFSSSQPPFKSRSPLACLLPPYDEYLIAYRDRSAAFDGSASEEFRLGNPIFDYPLLLNGKVVGGWKRTIKNGALNISISVVRAPSKLEKKSIEEAVNSYAVFLGILSPINFSLSST